MFGKDYNKYVYFAIISMIVPYTLFRLLFAFIFVIAYGVNLQNKFYDNEIYLFLKTISSYIYENYYELGNKFVFPCSLIITIYFGVRSWIIAFNSDKQH